jgi:hypothetical protein
MNVVHHRASTRKPQVLLMKPTVTPVVDGAVKLAPVLPQISHGVVSEDLVCPTEPVKVSFFLTLEPMNIFEENLDRRVDRLTWVLVALVS